VLEVSEDVLELLHHSLEEVGGIRPKPRSDPGGRVAEARAEFERAVSLTRNAKQRERRLERAAACRAEPEQPERR
jgi:hypothetical protein